MIRWRIIIRSDGSLLAPTNLWCLLEYFGVRMNFCGAHVYKDTLSLLEFILPKTTLKILHRKRFPYKPILD